MKKVMLLMMAVSLVLCLGACGGAAGNDNTKPTNDGTTNPEPGFKFVYKNTEISMHAPAEPILAALGTPIKYTESASCAFDGLDKNYYYGSFYLDTYPKDGKDYVYGWWFADDSVSTEEGIFIGSSQADVEKSYGTDGYNGTNAFVITRGGGTLTVILEAGVVTSIQYAIILN